MLDRMSDALSLLAAPLIEAAERLGAPGADAALERPADPEHGDYATTLALRLAKPLRRAPREIAEELAAAARESDVGRERRRRRARASSTSASRPPGTPRPCAGRASRASAAAPRTRRCASTSSTSRPTRPGRCPSRPAATPPTATRSRGSSRSPGHDVTREYYFNDSGAQIERFGLSLRARARGEQVPEDGYQGESLIELAQRHGLSPDAPAEEFGRAGVELMFAAIRATLERFRVHMDVYTNEVDLHRSGGVERALERARAAGHVFEQDGATWLRASEFGDDKDRVAAQGRRLADVPRRRPRVPGRQARARLRPRDLRARRRPPRLLGAAEGGRAGARLRPLAHRDRAVPDGAPDRGRRAEAHVQAARRRRAARRPDGRHRRGRGALLPRAALARRDDRHRPRPGRRAGPREPRLLRAVRARAHLLDPAPRRRGRRRGARRRAAPEPSEAALVRALADFPDVCRAAVDLRAPHRVVAYARDLAAASRRSTATVPCSTPTRPRCRSSRLALCDATRQVLARALDLVGVSAPQEM